MTTIKTNIQKILGVSLLMTGACGFLHGQQNLLTVSPNQLTFNPGSGSQNITVVSNTGAALNYTVSSSASWLSTSSTSGMTPSVVIVSAAPGSMNTGSYAGFITISTAGFTQTIPVTLNVNAMTNSSIIGSPSSLTFNFPSGATNPRTQSLVLSSPNGIFSYTAAATTGSGGNFLTLGQSSGSSNSPLSVTVNPTGLGNGSYIGSVTINGVGNTGIVIPVYVNVGTTGAINIFPEYLNFAYQTGTSAPLSQGILLTTTTGNPISYTTTVDTSSCTGNWLTVTPQSGTAPGPLVVSINPAGLVAGACPGSIYIYAPGAVNQTIAIPVVLTVANTPLLNVPSFGPSFYFQTGATMPGTQMFQLTNTSPSTPTTYGIYSTPASGGPDFLTVTPAGGTTPGNLAFALNPANIMGLAPGTYAENVAFPTGAGNAMVATVDLIVGANPFLLAPATPVSFNYQTGQMAPASQTINLTSTGGPVAYNAYTAAFNCPGFFSVSPTAGTTALQAGQQTQLTVTLNTANLNAPQTCNGEVFLSTPGGQIPPIIIPVSATVSGTPLLSLSQQSINLTLTSGATMPIPTTIQLSSTDPKTVISYSATVTLNNGGNGWLAVTAGTGMSPDTLTVTVNPDNLAPGIYTGSVTINSTNNGIAAQTIPVVVTVM